MKIIRVVAGWIEEGGRLLLGLRPEGEEWGGYWEFPGGKQKEEESEEESIKRELEEELGIVVKPQRKILEFVLKEGNKKYKFSVLKCRIIQGKPIPYYHEKIAWVEKEKVPSLHLASADRIIAEVLAHERT